METKSVIIGEIPALIWGPERERVILAVHGSMSHKADTPIQLLAEQAAGAGWQVLSLDLPEHGDRKNSAARCEVQTCTAELKQALRWIRVRWSQIGLFGNSLGAYFGLLACQGEPLVHAWFLSPVVDMVRLIENMMDWFQVTPERLEREGRIPTPMGQDLDWDYYCYVREHPVEHWPIPTDLLYGSRDGMIERESVEAFAHRFACRLEVAEGAEHYFHTPEQLDALRKWLACTLMTS